MLSTPQAVAPSTLFAAMGAVTGAADAVGGMVQEAVGNAATAGLSTYLSGVNRAEDAVAEARAVGGEALSEIEGTALGSTAVSLLRGASSWLWGE